MKNRCKLNCQRCPISFLRLEFIDIEILINLIRLPRINWYTFVSVMSLENNLKTSEKNRKHESFFFWCQNLVCLMIIMYKNVITLQKVWINFAKFWSCRFAILVSHGFGSYNKWKTWCSPLFGITQGYHKPQTIRTRSYQVSHYTLLEEEDENADLKIEPLFRALNICFLFEYNIR